MIGIAVAVWLGGAFIFTDMEALRHKRAFFGFGVDKFSPHNAVTEISFPGATEHVFVRHRPPYVKMKAIPEPHLDSLAIIDKSTENPSHGANLPVANGSSCEKRKITSVRLEIRREYEWINSRLNPEGHVAGWCGAHVADGDQAAKLFLRRAVLVGGVFKVGHEVSAQFALAHFVGNFGGAFGGFSSTYSGFGSNLGCLNGFLVSLQGLFNKPHPDKTNQDLGKSTDDHPERPQRHILLGLKILLLSLVFIGGFLFGYRSFERSYSAANVPKENSRGNLVPTVLWFCASFAGIVLSAGAFTSILSLLLRGYVYR